jgi:cytokinesis protein
LTLEETRKRNEASMRRKNINPALTNTNVGASPISPASTGAMDLLMEKLRAAPQQARDQRDRRRRARLQNRHQVRVASGQEIPDEADDTPEGDGGLLSPDSGATEDAEPKSEGEDIAERAASMLQGLRGKEGEEEDSGNIRARRRRESAEARRRRRTAAGVSGSAEPGGNEDSYPKQSTILEDPAEHEARSSTEVTMASPPMTIVSPPSDGEGEGKSSEHE